MTEIQNFKLASADLLEKYQHLEETIKACLQSYILCLDSNDSKPCDERKLGKITLGASVTEFAKIHSDDTLISDLRRVVPERNKLAHGSLSLTIGECSDKDYLMRRTTELKDLTAQITEIHNRVLEVRFLYKRREREKLRKSKSKIT